MSCDFLLKLRKLSRLGGFLLLLGVDIFVVLVWVVACMNWNWIDTIECDGLGIGTS